MFCYGCDRPIREAHKTIEEHLACEAAQQARVRAELDAEEAKAPKYDKRFLARNRNSVPARRK